MYIKKIEITNIRNIEKFEWELPDGQDLAGWHVLIGDNGSGKTTILRAMALALVGIDGAVFPLGSGSWIKYNETDGHISLLVHRDIDYDEWESSEIKERHIGINFLGEGGRTFNSHWDDTLGLENKQHGWFSVAYGPFRRFTGGGEIRGSILVNGSFPPTIRLMAHASVFSDEVALSQTLHWLQDLRFQQLENRIEGQLLDKIKSFINDDSLPFGVKLKEISSFGIFFSDANKNIVDIEDLANGYRSILSVTLEIIRQMSIFYPDKPLFNEDFTQVIPPGVVIIDEVDAHLHPSWQREIGTQLTKHFPNIQFIVTTHSPLVCQLPFIEDEQGNKKVKGSIFRLPTPGTDEVGELLKEGSENWKRLVYGDILEAYSTDLFGVNIDRSPEAQEIIAKLAKLSALEYERRLTDNEKAELKSLMDQLPNTPINL